MTRNLAANFAAALAATFMAAGCSLTLDTAKYEPKQAGDCASGTKPCGYKCVPDNDPATGCGSPNCAPCGGALGANQQVACNPDLSCGAGCLPGFVDCDGTPSNGCEVSLSLAANCGACGRSCGAESCLGPDWTCAPRVASPPLPGVVVTGVAAPSLSASPYVVGVEATGAAGFTTSVDVTGTGFGPVNSGLVPLFGLLASGDYGWTATGSFNATSPPAAIPLTFPVSVTLGPPAVAPGTGMPRGLAMASSGAWMIHSGPNPLCYVSDLSSIQCIPVGSPPTAIASAPWLLPEKVFVADASGTISTFENPLSPISTGSPIVSGAGNVGAMVARLAGAITELYWTDLATGDVRRWTNAPGPAVTTVFHGARPTSRMGIAATGTAVYWTDETEGKVTRYEPATGTTLLIGRSTAPQLITIGGGGWAFWSDADGSIRSTPW